MSTDRWPREGDVVWIEQDNPANHPYGEICAVLEDDVLVEFHTDEWHPEERIETYPKEMFYGFWDENLDKWVLYKGNQP